MADTLKLDLSLEAIGGPEIAVEVVVSEGVQGRAFTREDGSEVEGRPRWHIGFRPLFREVRGETGLLHNYIPYSTYSGSPLHQFLLALHDLGIRLREPSDLVGHRFRVKRRDIEYTVAGQTRILSGVWWPVGPLTAEDQQRLAHLPTPAAERQTKELTDLPNERLLAAAEVLNGKTPDEVKKIIYRDPVFTEDRLFQSAAANGKVIEELIRRGLLVYNSGRYIKAS